MGDPLGVGCRHFHGLRVSRQTAGATIDRPVAYRLPLGVAGIDIRLLSRGRTTPFSDWLDSLKDARTIGIVRARLNRVRVGNFGDCKPVGGGIEELRIDFGPGYRIYFGRDGSLVVIF